MYTSLTLSLDTSVTVCVVSFLRRLHCGVGPVDRVFGFVLR